jgi:cyanophycin synthetase
MRRRCSGQVIWFSMDEPGSEVREMIEAHCRRGGKALVLNPSDRGEMIVVKHGRREMQLAWTHLLPATFNGRARMNVQNSLAAAAAAFAAGAPLQDIRQGLRTFSTNYYLSPGRLNEVEVNGIHVIVDYCHNAPGMRMLGDFVDRVGDSLSATSELGRLSRIAVIATAGDRRDEDMRELGGVAAEHFDVVIVREDDNLRRRQRGETSGLVADGVRKAMSEGARCKQVEVVLEEIDAVRHALSRANAGDLVVICVDQHGRVMSELENWSNQAQAGSGENPDAPAADPDYTPAEAGAAVSTP